MKKILGFLPFLFCHSAKAQQQQEPTTFIKHDTIKCVLHSYGDSTTLVEKKTKAYKVFEIRKGDQTGQIYSTTKNYLNQDKKKIVDFLSVYNEVIFDWKEEKKGQ